MCDFEKVLGDRNFYRCHKCYMINLDYVDSVTMQDIILTTGETIPISKYRKDAFMKRIAEYVCENVGLEADK